MEILICPFYGFAVIVVLIYIISPLPNEAKYRRMSLEKFQFSGYLLLNICSVYPQWCVFRILIKLH